jgi:hypothetical protein
MNHLALAAARAFYFEQQTNINILQTIINALLHFT